MGVGKYSPTVSFSYNKNQNWFYEHQADDTSWYDRDGYDSYGYNAEGKDRAGYSEMDYLSDGRYDEDADYVVHALYEDISSDWAGRYIPTLEEHIRKGVA